jgi:hypothetical protein
MTQPLDYQRPALRLIYPKPTRHPALTGWAWAMFVVEAVYRGSVVAYAYSRTNTYVWERFERNVGSPEVFGGIDIGVVVFGMVLAAASLLEPNTKRWASVLALIGHIVLLLRIMPLDFLRY